MIDDHDCCVGLLRNADQMIEAGPDLIRRIELAISDIRGERIKDQKLCSCGLDRFFNPCIIEGDRSFLLIDKDKFLKMLVYMLEKEYIIQTSQIVIPNFELKYEYPDFQTNIINELQSIFKEKDHSQKENTIIQANEERKEGNNEIYFEDGLEQVKQLNIKDYEVLQYILPLLHKKLFIEEIAYLSGYKFMKLHEIFEKYPWLFTVIYINLNNEY